MPPALIVTLECAELRTGVFDQRFLPLPAIIAH